MEAIAAGAGEALLLDARGFVAEGSGKNLFFICQGTIYAIEHSVNFMGITRDSAIRIARYLGYEVRSVRATRDRLYRALARLPSAIADESLRVLSGAETFGFSFSVAIHSRTSLRKSPKKCK